MWDPPSLESLINCNSLRSRNWTTLCQRYVSLFAFSTKNYVRLSIELWYLNTVIEMEEHWESLIRASPISLSISESIHWNVKIMFWHLVFYFDIGAPEFDIWFWSDLLIGSEIILWWLRVEVFCLTCPWIEQPIRAPMVKRWIKQWWSLCYWRGFGILNLNLLQFQIVYQILMSITNYSPHTLWVNWPSDLAIVNPQNWHFSFSCQNKMLNSFPLYL